MQIYSVRISAYTSVGEGPASAPVQVKTQLGGMVLKIIFINAGHSLSILIVQEEIIWQCWNIKCKSSVFKDSD